MDVGETVCSECNSVKLLQHAMRTCGGSVSLVIGVTTYHSLTWTRSILNVCNGIVSNQIRVDYSNGKPSMSPVDDGSRI